MVAVGLLTVAVPSLASDAPYHFALARMYAAEGAVERAAESFRKAIELEPEDSYLRLEHAEFLRRRGLVRQAVREVETAVELDESNLEALRLFGYLHLDLSPQDSRSIRQAREAFERLREERPDDVPSMLTLSRIYLRIGEPGRALDVLEEADSFAPRQPSIRARFVEALSWGVEAERAEALLERLLASDPAFLEARLALATLHSERGEHEEAIALLDVVPEEGDPRGRFLLGLEFYREAVSPGRSWSARQEGLLRAGRTISELLQLDTEHSEALYLQALILSNVNRNADAIERLFNLAEGAHPSLQTRVIGKLAEILEHEGRAAEAARVLADLARSLSVSSSLTPAGGRIWLELARLEARERNWHRVVAAAERVIESEDTALRLEGALLRADAALKLDRSEEAIAVIERFLDQEGDGEPNPGTRLVLKHAEALFAAGRDREGRKLLAGLGEGDLDTLLAAAQYHLQRDDHEAVLPILRRAVLQSADEEPPRPGLRRELVLLSANSLEQVHRPEQALALLDRHAEEFAEIGGLDLHRFHLQRAAVLDAAKRHEEAESLYHELMTVSRPTSVLLTVQHFQGKGRWEELVPMLERAAAELEGDDKEAPIAVDLQFTLGMAFERLGRLADAEAAFLRALKLNPDDSRTLNYLGYTWAEKNLRLEEALTMILRAVELEPRNGAYLDSLGWVYFRLARYEEARAPLESAGKLVPDDATILEHMGDLYLALEKPEKAREFYRRAVAANDDENVEDVRQKLSRIEAGDGS